MSTAPNSSNEYGSLLGSKNQANKDDNNNDDRLAKTQQWSFWAGILYCIIIVCGITAEVGIRGSLLDFDDPQGTAENIASRPGALRVALMLDLCMSGADVVLSVVLGAIFVVSGAHAVLSLVAVTFRLMQQAVLATNLLHMFAASLLLDPTLPVASVVSDLFVGEKGGTGGASTNAESLAFLFLLLHKYGYLLALIFFGLSLGTMGYVVLVWGVFPKWLGGVLFLAGLGYVADSTLFFLWSSYDGQATAVLMLPALVAEFGFAACLLLKKQTLSEV